MKNGKLLKRADVILLAALLGVTLLLFLTQLLLRREGAQAVIYVDGVKTQTVSLDREQKFRIDHPDGSFNTVTVRDGALSVSEASCPDKICVKSHSIRYNGESITCLPNRTVIRIEGGSPGGVDIG